MTLLTDEEILSALDNVTPTYEIPMRYSEGEWFSLTYGRAVEAAVLAQLVPVAWRITTIGGRRIYDESTPSAVYSQEWLDRCREVLPLYALPKAE